MENKTKSTNLGVVVAVRGSVVDVGAPPHHPDIRNPAIARVSLLAKVAVSDDGRRVQDAAAARGEPRGANFPRYDSISD